MKAFIVEVQGFEDEPRPIVAAATRSKARMLVARSLCDDYFCDSRKMGVSLQMVKSVKRHHIADERIDQSNTRTRYLPVFTEGAIP